MAGHTSTIAPTTENHNYMQMLKPRNAQRQNIEGNVDRNTNGMIENILNSEINVAKTEILSGTTSSEDDNNISDLSDSDGSSDNSLYKKNQITVTNHQ